MNVANVLRILDEERRSLNYAGQRTEILEHVTRRSSADGSWHEVAHSHLDEKTIDQAIAAEVAHFRALGVPFEWKVFAHDSPPCLGERLLQAGFVPGPQESVMIRDLSEDVRGEPEVKGGSWLDSIEPGEGHVVRRVECEAQIAEFRRIAEAVFEKDYSFTSNELLQGLRSGSRDQIGYLAYFEDEPVAVGRLYTHRDSRFGGLYGGGTLPHYRGRGVYRALVAARARDAVARARYLLVDALPTSRPILERMGFTEATKTWPYEWTP